MQIIQAKINIINERLDALENDHKYVYERLDFVDKNHVSLSSAVNAAIANMQSDLSRRCDRLLGTLGEKIDRVELTEAVTGMAARAKRTERDCDEALNRLDRYVSRLENMKRDLMNR